MNRQNILQHTGANGTDIYSLMQVSRCFRVIQVAEGINICHYVSNSSFFANGFFLEVNYLLVAFDIDLTWEKTAHHILMIFCFFSKYLAKKYSYKKDQFEQLTGSWLLSMTEPTGSCGMIITYVIKFRQ